MNSVELEVLFQKLDSIGSRAKKCTRAGQSIRDKRHAMRTSHVAMYDGETQHHRMKKHCKRGGLEKTSCGSIMAIRRFDGSRITCVYKTHRF